MFTFSSPDITDNVRPFFVRSESTPNPNDITLTTFVHQDELSELIQLVEHFSGT
jgi:glycosyltransferase-like protein LARGE